MSVELKVDTSQWAAGIGNLLAVTSRSLPQVINSSAGSVAIKTYMYSKVANRKKIKATYRTTTGVLNENSFTKKGVLKKRRKMFKQVLGFRPWVYGKVREKHGNVKGDTLQEFAQDYYAKAQGSVGYVATGWRLAIEQFGKKFKSAYSFLQTHEYGMAQLSADTQFPYFVAMLGNSADHVTQASGFALQLALDREGAELKAEALKRIQRMTSGKKGANASA